MVKHTIECSNLISSKFRGKKKSQAPCANIFRIQKNIYDNYETIIEIKVKSIMVLAFERKKKTKKIGGIHCN